MALAAGIAVMLLVASGAAGTKYLLATGEASSFGSRISSRLSEPNRWTVVAALSPNCRFCTASMPFYARLRGTFADVPFVVTGRFAADDLAAYAEAHGLKATRYEAARKGELGQVATPTLFLLDPSGRVTTIWRGQLSPDEQRAVEEALRGTR